MEEKRRSKAAATVNAVNSKQRMLIFIFRSWLIVDLSVGHLSRDKPLFV